MAIYMFRSDWYNDLIAFINIAKQPNRIKCATIGVTGFQTLLLDLLKTDDD